MNETEEKIDCGMSSFNTKHQMKIISGCHTKVKIRYHFMQPRPDRNKFKCNVQQQ